MMARLVSVFGLALVLGACSSLVDNFTLTDGSTHDDDISLVNGSIEIGSQCRVNGQVGNVNGSIRIGDGSSVLDISNVNGRVSLGSNVTVDGDISSVNGRIELGPGTRVSSEVESINGRISAAEGVVIDGQISSINGRIEMTGARAALLMTNNSDIHLDAGTVITGELIVRKSQGINFDMGSPPRVVIGRDVQVGGPLNFEREVALFVHETARVGEINGAEPTMFSGDEP